MGQARRRASIACPCCGCADIVSLEENIGDPPVALCAGCHVVFEPGGACWCLMPATYIPPRQGPQRLHRWR